MQDKKEKVAELFQSKMLVNFPEEDQLQKQFKMLTEDELCIIEEVNEEKPKYILDLGESQFPSLSPEKV